MYFYLDNMNLDLIDQYLNIVKVRGAQPFEARVQQKEKAKLRGLHPGNTFITIKNTIYNTKLINVKLDAASAH